MSSSIVSILISSILALILMSNINIVTNAETNSPSLIESVCGLPDNKTHLCINVLESEPKILKAKNLYDLSIAIMSTGISNATNTRTYINDLLKKPDVGPNSKQALEECISSYNRVLGCYNSAYSEVVDDKEYETATYDLFLAANDGIQLCQNNADSGKIKDETIIHGSNIVIVYALSASNALDKL